MHQLGLTRHRLARDIRGIGFWTADQVAEELGIPKDSMLRARAGVSYALMEAVANGDCGLPQEDLLSLAEKLPEIGSPIIAEAMRQEMATGGVVEDVIEGKPMRIPPASASRGTGHRCGYPQAQAGAPPWLTGKSPLLDRGQAGRDACDANRGQFDASQKWSTRGSDGPEADRHGNRESIRRPVSPGAVGSRANNEPLIEMQLHAEAGPFGVGRPEVVAFPAPDPTSLFQRQGFAGKGVLQLAVDDVDLSVALVEVVADIILASPHR
jgi:hypothetical protein